jgi:hypothetical protein
LNEGMTERKIEGLTNGGAREAIVGKNEVG